MTYLVIKSFTDMQDDNFKYHTGDSFPRNGFEVSEQRINDLLTGNNRRGIPVIKAVETPAEVKENIVEEKPKRKRKDVK